MAGPSSYLTAVIFLTGLVTGLIVTSAVSNYMSVGSVLGERSLPSRGLMSLLRQYNETLAHEDVARRDRQLGARAPIQFDDSKFHNDDDSVANALFKRVRVLCWVMTTKNNHKKKAVHVKATWGKRCNKLIFISDADDSELPAVRLEVGSGRDHLTAKTMKAFDMVFQKELENYDWFMKADDDTYVIVENLRYLLSTHTRDEPIYFGHHFKTIVSQGYFSGGGGYVVSREGLRRFGNRGRGQCASDHGAEDVEFGRCMEKLGVKTGDSRDALGRSRFHCFNPATHIHGGYPDWYYQYDKYGGKKGIESMSDYTISFHYVDRQEMYNLEYFVYHLRPFGINSGHQHLNPKNHTHR